MATSTAHDLRPDALHAHHDVAVNLDGRRYNPREPPLLVAFTSATTVSSLRPRFKSVHHTPAGIARGLNGDEQRVAFLSPNFVPMIFHVRDARLALACSAFR
jgi:hypothetical protein